MSRSHLTHFQSADPIIHRLLQQHTLEPLKAETNAGLYFAKLCREIIGQQLSIKAADTIIKRFEALFPEAKLTTDPGEYRQIKTIGTLITPQAILAKEDQALREVGLSWSKVKYVKDLAQKTLDQELHLHLLPGLADEEVVTELTQVKGIGRWTAEMFLIFTLGREDVFSFGDLGLRRAMERHYGLTDWKQDEVMKIVEQWQPFRSYASLVLWKSLDNA
ncbi:MAG TPA: DNA-3-methyladenine glycosylase 2 family protein [Patescibacteria group bacterium]